LSGAKGKASDLRQPIEADPDDPRQVDIEDVLAEPAAPTQAEIVRANLARIDAPEAKDWHRALEALRGMKTPCRGHATGGASNAALKSQAAITARMHPGACGDLCAGIRSRPDQGRVKGTAGGHFASAGAFARGAEVHTP
jgi:hypothetical protein